MIGSRTALRSAAIIGLPVAALLIVWFTLHAARSGSTSGGAGDVHGTTNAEVVAAPALRGAPGPAQDANHRRGASSTTPEPSPPHGVLRGVVVTAATGEPIEGCHLFLAADEYTLTPRARTVRSDPDGTFVLELAVHGSSRLIAVAEGYLPSSVPVERPVEDGDSAVVRLHRGASISGKVVDDRGVPVEGARVWSHAEENRVAWPTHESFFSADTSGGVSTSNERGEYEIRGLHEDAMYEVHAMKAGYAESERHAKGALLRANTQVDVVLTRVAGVRLTVVDDATGASIPCASTRMSAGRHARALRWTGTMRRLSRLSGTGVRDVCWFRPVNEKLAEGSLTLRVGADAPGYHPVREIVALEWGTVREVTMRLACSDPRGTASVLFTASIEGGPVFNGPLELFVKSLAGSGLPAVVSVDFRDGVIKEPLALPPGRYAITPHGAFPAGMWWHPAGPTQEVLIPGSAADLLEAPLKLIGRQVQLTVEDSSGARRRGYSVAVEYEDGTGGILSADWDVPVVGSDAPDRGQMLWLSPKPAILRVILPGVGSAEADLSEEVAAETVRLRLELTPFTDGR